MEVLYYCAAILLQGMNGTDYGVYLALGGVFQLDLRGVFLEVGKGKARRTAELVQGGLAGARPAGARSWRSVASGAR